MNNKLMTFELYFIKINNYYRSFGHLYAKDIGPI